MSRKAESKLIVLSAPSGAGKSTIAAMLLDRHPNLRLSVSFTTRQPRGQEKEGVHYFFVSDDRFGEMIARGELLEHARVFDKHWYGTSRAKVESLLAAGHSVIFDIDVQGARSLKSAYGPRCVTIFLLPPSLDELESRLRNRGTESAAAIAVRMDAAREEMKAAPTFDYRIENRELGNTVREVESVLRKEYCVA